MDCNVMKIFFSQKKTQKIEKNVEIDCQSGKQILGGVKKWMKKFFLIENRKFLVRWEEFFFLWRENLSRRKIFFYCNSKRIMIIKKIKKNNNVYKWYHYFYSDLLWEKENVLILLLFMIEKYCIVKFQLLYFGSVLNWCWFNLDLWVIFVWKLNFFFILDLYLNLVLVFAGFQNVFGIELNLKKNVQYGSCETNMAVMTWNTLVEFHLYWIHSSLNFIQSRL